MGIEVRWFNWPMASVASTDETMNLLFFRDFGYNSHMARATLSTGLKRTSQFLDCIKVRGKVMHE